MVVVDVVKMQVFGNFGKGAAASEDDARLTQLLHRVEETSTVAEKLAALNEVKDLFARKPSEREKLGQLDGISILVRVLSEREDASIAQGVLEVLLSALSDEGAPAQTSAASSLNCGIFCQSNERLVVLLSLFEPDPIGIDDFYVHYHAIQLLECCLRTAPYKLQEVVGQNGTTGLLRMLSEREAIRNEVILILNRLADGYEQIKESLAHGGVFGQLFEIMRGEGGCEGGIVVQDCLELLKTLLKGNLKTQELFREAGLVLEAVKWLQLVDVRAEGVESLLSVNQTLSQQRLINLKSLLGAVHELLEDSIPIETLKANCQAFHQGDCLPVFSQICLNEGGVRDHEIRVMAFHSISQVLRLVSESKKLLAKIRVFLDSQQTEAIRASLLSSKAMWKVVLSTREPQEAVMVVASFLSFFDSNPEGQEWIMGSLQAPTAFFLEMLYTMETLKDGLDIGKRASQVMMGIMKGNVRIQSLFASKEISIPNRPPTRLLHWAMELLKYCVEFRSDPNQCLAIVEWIICCLEENPSCIEAFFQQESHMNFLITKLQENLGDLQNPYLKTTSGIPLILGSCLEAVIQDEQHPKSQPLKGYLINILQVSIGIDNFLLVLEKLVPLIQLESLSRCLVVLKSQFQPEETPVSDNEASKRNEELMRSQETINLLGQEKVQLIEQLKQSQQQVYSHQNEIHSLKKQIDQENEEMLLCIGLQQLRIKALGAKLEELGLDPKEVVASSTLGELVMDRKVH